MQRHGPVPWWWPRRDAETVVTRLTAAGCVAAEEEAGELLAAAPDEKTLERWLLRREEGEPLWSAGSLLQPAACSAPGGGS